MRLFVAADVNDSTRAAVAALIERLQRRMKRADIKWVPAANLHVTLQFIGYVDADKASRICDALSQPIAVAPFEMRIGGLGVFPPRGGPRVVWCGVGEAASALAAVQHDIETRLVAQQLIVPETRPFHAHLTVGRYRGSGPVADRRLLEQVRGGELGRSMVECTTLYESRLSPHGPTYAPIAHTPLSGTIAEAKGKR